ncbi:MAG: hypothetical protein WCP69_01730 [Bacteroidota bacterium]
MIIVGAGSSGKETLGMMILQSIPFDEIVFFDDNYKGSNLIFGKYQVITDVNKMESYINEYADFCIAVGNPRIREKLYSKMILWGGKAKNIISPSSYCISTISENGTIIQPGVSISYDFQSGKSCIIHSNSVIGHKVIIGDFVNISPLVSIVGPLSIGDYSYVGAGSVILPNIKIGKNVYISAGSVIEKDVADFETIHRK